MSIRRRLKDAVFSFSLANLCLLNVWCAVLSASQAPSQYFRKSTAELSFVRSTLIVSGLASFGFWILVQLARKVNSSQLDRLMESGLLLLMVFPLGTALREILLLSDNTRLSNLIFLIVVVVKLGLITAALFIVLTPARLVVCRAKACVFLMAPLALVLLASIGGARLAADSDQEPQTFPQQVSKDLSSVRRGPRLLILKSLTNSTSVSPLKGGPNRCRCRSLTGFAKQPSSAQMPIQPHEKPVQPFLR